MAVINPIPKKKKEVPAPEDPSKTINLSSKQAALRHRPMSVKALPDHLIRPPIDVLLEPIPKPKKFDLNEHDEHLTITEQKKLKEEQSPLPKSLLFQCIIL